METGQFTGYVGSQSWEGVTEFSTKTGTEKRAWSGRIVRSRENSYNW